MKNFGEAERQLASMGADWKDTARQQTIHLRGGVRVVVKGTSSVPHASVVLNSGLSSNIDISHFLRLCAHHLELLQSQHLAHDLSGWHCIGDGTEPSTLHAHVGTLCEVKCFTNLTASGIAKPPAGRKWEIHK
jgi:hypothetical protein